MDLNMTAASASDRFVEASVRSKSKEEVKKNEKEEGVSDNPIIIDDSHAILVSKYSKVVHDCAALKKEITMLQCELELKKEELEKQRQGLFQNFFYLN